MRFVHNRFPTIGNANGVTAGNRINGAAVLTRKVAPGSLNAEVTVDAETTSLAFALVWQGSNDRAFTAPIDLAGNTLNGAPTPLATGTAGADAAVSKVLPAPQGAYCYRYARAQLVVAGATGTTNDTFQIAYGFGDPSSLGRKRRT